MKKKHKHEEPIKLYGWICPKCGKVNAPFNRECNCHVKTIKWPPEPQPWRSVGTFESMEKDTY